MEWAEENRNQKPTGDMPTMEMCLEYVLSTNLIEQAHLLSKIEAKERSKDAPVLSSLLIKHIRDTFPSSAYRQLVSDCGSTPATPSKTTTAPSKTRKLLFTSAVKSMCPGVSIMLKRYSGLLPFGAYVGFQKQVIAAAVMVMPRSRSCSIQSVTVSPS